MRYVKLFKVLFLKSCEAIVRELWVQSTNELNEASHDPPLSRLREAPVSDGRVQSLGEACGTRGGSAITAAMFLLCSGSLALRTGRVLHFVQSPLSVCASRSHSCGARRASPHRPLFYCQPTFLTCARNVGRSTKVFMEISFRMRLVRLLAWDRQYKSTITNGRVN